MKYIPTGAFCYTRRPKLFDFSISNREWYKNGDDNKRFGDQMKSYNYLDTEMPHIVKSEDQITVEWNNEKNDERKSVDIAFSHFKSTDNYYSCQLNGIAGCIERKDQIQRVASLINKNSHEINKTDYLVFHEISFPRKLMSFTCKNTSTKTNLILGLEYSKINNSVCNEVAICIKVGYPFWSALCFIQSKIIPAVHENNSIRDEGLQYLPLSIDKFVFNIDQFRFSTLICNEFLDINNRANLRGLIDCLIVIAWNQDTTVYDSLTQSATMDLHSFVAIINNRKYGDSRLHGPYKKSFKRDVLRVSGGNSDLIMIGTVDHHALKEFQIEKQKNPVYNPNDEFKPLPSGFMLDL